MPRNLPVLALIASLPQEVGPLVRRIRARRLPGLPFPAWEFRTGAVRGIVALAGMGARGALAVSAALLERQSLTALWSVGFAGALSPAAAVGDLVIGEAFYRVGAAGELRESMAPVPFIAVRSLLARLRAAGVPARMGACLSPAALTPKSLLRPHAARLPCPILDLESAALAELAAARGLPFLALRAVSDAAGEEMPDFIAQAVAESRPPTFRDALGWLKEDPRRLPVLVRLWRQSFRAARRLARGLAVALEMAAA